MFRLETCVTATCDTCVTAYPGNDDDYPGILHFPDQADAEQSISEDGRWRVLAGGRLTCRHCAAQQDCATYGCQWDPWLPCACGGRVRDHDTDQQGACISEELRWCDRCLRTEHRPTTQEVRR